MEARSWAPKLDKCGAVAEARESSQGDPGLYTVGTKGGRGGGGRCGYIGRQASNLT